jgi:putative SOS response-associated peptidase YedK
MCNLYNITTNQEAIRQFIGIMEDRVGNLEPSLDLDPDRPAPVVRNVGNGGRELARLTWGMPTPEMLLKPGAPDTGVTNVRKIWLPHWRHWLDVGNRCVVPATAFCEYSQTPDPVTKKKPKVWFAIDESQPLFFFAGIWTNWSGVRGSMKTPRAGDHELFAFLTCNPNGIVAPIHPKAMPVILTLKDEIETWLTADWKEAKALQRPLTDDGLTIVARGETTIEQGRLLD